MSETSYPAWVAQDAPSLLAPMLVNKVVALCRFRSPGVLLEALHRHRQSVRTDPGVHHTLYTREEWPDEALLPITERRVHLAAPVRVAGPCPACGQPMDPVLQR